MFNTVPTGIESVVGLTLLFAVTGWLVAVTLAASLALQRRGVAYAVLAVMLGLFLGPVAILWAGRLRRQRESDGIDILAPDNSAVDLPSVAERRDRRDPSTSDVVPPKDGESAARAPIAEAHMDQGGAPLVMAYLDSTACDFVLSRHHPTGLTLDPRALAAVELARASSVVLGIRDVRCSETEARLLIDYLSAASDAFGNRGDNRAALCARAEQALRKALTRVRP